jgi:hypothetical protein
MTSTTDKENKEPNRATPKTDNELPTRAKLRRAKDEPTGAKPSTDNVEGKRTKLLSETDEPK